MSRPIITKVKSLRRDRPYRWCGHNRTRKSATLEVRVEFWPSERRFYIEMRHRQTRSCDWTTWRPIQWAEDRTYLMSLLGPDDVAACTAAALTRNHAPRRNP